MRKHSLLEQIVEEKWERDWEKFSKLIGLDKRRKNWKTKNDAGNFHSNREQQNSYQKNEHFHERQEQSSNTNQQSQFEEEQKEKLDPRLKKCYTILGLNENASPKEIKRAFRRLAIRWHPDKHRSSKQKDIAEKEMKKINLAYEQLEKAGKVS